MVIYMECNVSIGDGMVLGRFLLLFAGCVAPPHIEMCGATVLGRSGCSYRGAINNKDRGPITANSQQNKGL